MQAVWILLIGIILGMFLSFYIALVNQINSHKIVYAISNFTLDTVHPRVSQMLAKYENLTIIDKQTCNECNYKLDVINDKIDDLTILIENFTQFFTSTTQQPSKSPIVNSRKPSLSPTVYLSTPINNVTFSPSYSPSSADNSSVPAYNSSSRFLRQTSSRKRRFNRSRNHSVPLRN